MPNPNAPNQPAASAAIGASASLASIGPGKAASAVIVTPAQGSTGTTQSGTLVEWAATNPVLTGSAIAAGVALTVGLLTFLGVLLSLKAATKRMKIEIEHAAIQAMREREYSRSEASTERRHSASEAHVERVTTMRRTVYLEAVEQLVQAQVYLAGLAKADLTKVDIGAGLAPFQTAVAKVAVVAEQPTALKAREVSSMFALTLIKGLDMLMPMVKLKGDVDFHDEHYAATQVDIKRILAAMAHHNETQQKDAGAFAALQQSFDHQQAMAAEHSKKRVAAKLQLSDAEGNYSMTVLADMRSAAGKLDELACAIRLELGLEADLEVFQNQTVEVQKRMDDALRELQARAAAMREEVNA